MTANPETTSNDTEKPFILPELRFIDPNNNGEEITLTQLRARRELGQKAVAPLDIHVVKTGYAQKMDRNNLTFQTPEGLTYGI